MRRTRVVFLAGCLLVAGGAGTGTASGAEPGDQPAIPPVERPSTSAPQLPGPGPRVVEPDRRPPGTMPEVVPRGPRAAPMPQLHSRELLGPRSRPVPMPQFDQDDQLDQHDHEPLIPPSGSLPQSGTLLRGGSQSPGD